MNSLRRGIKYSLDLKIKENFEYKDHSIMIYLVLKMS